MNQKVYPLWRGVPSASAVILIWKGTMVGGFSGGLLVKAAKWQVCREEVRSQGKDTPATTD